MPCDNITATRRFFLALCALPWPVQQLGQALRHLLDAEQEGLALLGREAAAPSRHELVRVRVYRVRVRVREH